MTLDIELTPQTEAWLNAEAQQRGILPGDLVRRVIEERAAVAVEHPGYKTPQERIRAMDALAEACSDRPYVPDTAFDRENIYLAPYTAADSAVSMRRTAGAR